MKRLFLPILIGIIFLSIAASLSAGEVIFYGGAQKPGKLSWSDASPFEIVDDLKGDFGGTFGIRFSKGRAVGFEQGIGYSPQFAKPGVKAFQTDTNLIIQAPGKVAPYATAGIGLVRSWGQDDLPASSDPGEIAAFVFSMGTNFAINYGGGLKIRRLAGPIGFNIDVRGYNLPGARVKLEEQSTEKGLSFIQTTAGLVISW